DGQDRALSIYSEVHRRVVFIERAVPRFTFPEQILHLLPVCHVDTDANDPFWLSIIVVGNEASLLDPSDLTARTNDTKLCITFTAPFAEDFAPTRLPSLHIPSCTPAHRFPA